MYNWGDVKIKEGSFFDFKEAALGYDVRIGFSDRSDRQMNIFSKKRWERIFGRKNLNAFFRQEKVFEGDGSRRIICCEHQNGNNIRIISSAKRTPPDKKFGDGLITFDPSVVLTASGCDCSCLFLFNPFTRVLGIAHCGWRSIAKGVVGKLVGKILALEMKIGIENFGTFKFMEFPDLIDARSDQMIAIIGPGICQKCFAVGKDTFDGLWKTRANFERSNIPYQEMFEKRLGGGKYHIDLKKIISTQLRTYGLKEVFVSQECTSCDDKFFSYRRDGEKNQQIGYITHSNDLGAVLDEPVPFGDLDSCEICAVLSYF